jgi:hypothetical protein
MSMTYTWEILKLGTLDQTNDAGEVLSDAIISVKWKKIATNDANKKASYVSTTKLDLSTTSAADYVALDDVNKANVIEWVEEALGADKIATINTILASKVEQNTMTMITPNW